MSLRQVFTDRGSYVLAVFPLWFWLESGKIRKNKDHMFFIPLFLAKSLRRCLNTEPSVLMFNLLPQATSKKHV